MDLQNDENVQPAQVTPSPEAIEPAAQVAASAEVVTPVESNTVADKTTLAFIKQRQARKADKQRIVALEAQLAAAQPVPVATPVPAPVAPVVVAPAQPQQVQAETGNIDDELAIQAIANDKQVQSVPGAILDIMELVDTNPKLAKLNAIDSNLAFAEATKMWKAKLGLAATPKLPIATKISGGMSSGNEDLGNLFQALDQATPGTKAYRELVAKVNKAMGNAK